MWGSSGQGQPVAVSRVSEHAGRKAASIADADGHSLAIATGSRGRGSGATLLPARAGCALRPLRRNRARAQSMSYCDARWLAGARRAARVAALGSFLRSITIIRPCLAGLTTITQTYQHPPPPTPTQGQPPPPPSSTAHHGPDILVEVEEQQQEATSYPSKQTNGDGAVLSDQAHHRAGALLLDAVEGPAAGGRGAGGLEARGDGCDGRAGAGRVPQGGR